MPVTLVGGGNRGSSGGDTGGSGVVYSQGEGIIIIGTLISVDPSVIIRKVPATIGDGVSVSFVIQHKLNTRDILISIQEISTGIGVLADWTSIDANNAQITFGSAPNINQYRIVVVG